MMNLAHLRTSVSAGSHGVRRAQTGPGVPWRAQTGLWTANKPQSGTGWVVSGMHPPWYPPGIPHPGYPADPTDPATGPHDAG